MRSTKHCFLLGKGSLVSSPSETWFWGMSVGGVFPAGVGPYSLLRDASNWLSTRFSRSVDKPRRFGWLRMVSTRCASSERQFGTLREEVARERQVALAESLVGRCSTRKRAAARSTE